MAYKLVVSREAHKDIDEIVHYIAVELSNPTAAASFLDNVEKCYQSIINNPLLYCLCNDSKLRNNSYRKIVIKNYLILYRADEKAKTVFIVRIIYGGRNYVELI